MTPAADTLAERFERSLAALHGFMALWDWEQEGAPCPGVVVRRTKLFHPGDVVFEYIHNGQGERWSFVGWSSKKRTEIGPVYLQFARTQYWQRLKERSKNRPAEAGKDYGWKTHENRSTVRLFAVPDEFKRSSWTDPDLRGLALSALRAAYSAFPVCTSSGGATTGGP